MRLNFFVLIFFVLLSLSLVNSISPVAPFPTNPSDGALFTRGGITYGYSALAKTWYAQNYQTDLNVLYNTDFNGSSHIKSDLTTDGKVIVRSDINALGGLNANTIRSFDNNSLSLQTLNTARLTVLADGNVGIGIAAPQALLDVNGSILERHPAVLARVGQVSLNTNEDYALRIAVVGKYAYMTTWTTPNRLIVVDITNPLAPARIGALILNSDENYGYGLAVSGKYAYMSTDTIPGRLVVVDVSNPSNPVRVGAVTFNTNENAARDVFISGRYAYVTTYTSPGRIVVIDISNPSNPVRIGAITLSTGENQPYKVVVSKKYAYTSTCTSPGRFITLDVSIPSNPVKISALTLNTDENCGLGLSVSGRYAYISTNTSPTRLVTVDISNPTVPARAGAVTFSSGENSAIGISVSGRYAYMSTNSSPINVMAADISNPNNPTRVSGLTLNSGENLSYGIAVLGRYAYIPVATVPSGFVTVDLMGADLSSLSTGSISAGTVNITDALDVSSTANIHTALNVGIGGIYSQGQLSVMDVNRLGVNSMFVVAGDSNTGIGTLTPQNKLNVLGDLNVVALAGTGAPYLYVRASDGNVGIGTTAPSYPLDVNGQNALITAVFDSSNTNGTTIGLNNTSVGAHNFVIFTTGSENSPGHFGIFDLNSNKTIFDVNGNSGDFGLIKGAQIGWTNTNFASGTPDTGMTRQAAGVVKVTNGSTGLGDLNVGNITGKTIDKGGTVYNVNAYGITSGSSNQSAALSSLMTIVYNAGGGTIYFPAGNYRFDSQIIIPNDGVSSQKWMRLTGEGSSSILDLRYNVSNNGGKITTLGFGYLEIDHLTILNYGSDTNSDVPFIFDVATNMKIHNVDFDGSANPSTIQDAIVLGSGDCVGPVALSITSQFGGYGTIIEKNNFSHLNRGVYGQGAANGIVFKDNWFGANVGTTAIEFKGCSTGPAQGDYGEIITGNLLEMDVYHYGVKFDNTSQSTLNNGFYDDYVALNPDLVSENYFSNNSLYNVITSNENFFDSYGVPQSKSFDGDTNSIAKTTVIGGNVSYFGNKVGIGTATPANKLNVVGDLNVTGVYYGDGSQLTGIVGGSGATWAEINAVVPWADANIASSGKWMSQSQFDLNFNRDNNSGSVWLGSVVGVPSNAVFNGAWPVADSNLASSFVKSSVFNAFYPVNYDLNVTNKPYIPSSAAFDSNYATKNVVKGFGTANYIPKFSDANTLNNSMFYQSGTNIGMGTTTPIANVTVGGTALDINGLAAGLRLDENGGLWSYTEYLANGVSKYIMGYRASTTNFEIVAGGTLVSTSGIILASTGKVGIDTAPTYNLDVNGQLRVFPTTGTATTSLFTAADGNVGIGTATPANKLNVVGDLNVQGFNLSSDAFRVDANTADHNVSFVIDKNGHVGIGKSNSTLALDISGTVQATQFQVSSNVYFTGSGVTATYLRGTTNYPQLSLNTDTFVSSSTRELMRLVSSTGYLGIGDSTPDALLDVNGINNNADVLRIDANGNVNPITALLVDKNGNVGIGTAAPSSNYALDVNGTLRASSGYFSTTSGVGPGAFYAQGYTTTTQANNIIGGASGSSYRLGALLGNNNYPTANYSGTSLLVSGDTFYEASSGNHPIIATAAILKPRVVNGAATVGNTAALYVEDENNTTTVGGGNWAVWVDSGKSRFDGNMVIGSDDNTLNTIGNTLKVVGDVNATGTLAAGGGSLNHAVCWKANGVIGYCSSIVGADGTCTCV